MSLIKSLLYDIHMFLLVIILVCSSLQYLSYETFHFSTRPPLRMAGFGKKGVQIFSSKKPTKFGSFGHFFFQKAHKKLTLWIPAIFLGRADKKWNVSIWHKNGLSTILATSELFIRNSGSWLVHKCLFLAVTPRLVNLGKLSGICIFH